MKSTKSIFLIALVLSAFALTGCETDEAAVEKSSVPWARPASWEHQMPGFGGAGF